MSNTTFTPSKYQEAIFEWVKTGRGDAFVEAVAGSGKTTTLVQAAKLVSPHDSLFLAFNKLIVNELVTKLGPAYQVKTLNALGHGALMKGLGKKKLILNANKYNDILFDSLKDMVEKKNLQEVLKVCRELTSLAMSNLADPSDEGLTEVADHYGIVTPSALSLHDTFNLVRNTLQTGEAQAKAGIISFDDQIWLPVKWGFSPSKVSFILIDEAQDLSKAKLELALMARGPGARILFVGDPKQSIYGFAGADARAVPNILERTGAKVLPLSVCYRCPVSVIEHAKKLVPHIEAAPNAKPGEVKEVKESELPVMVKNGDLILSRITAPLVTLCIRLIGQKIPARVRGRDIGKSIVATAKEALEGASWGEIMEKLDTYHANHTAVLMTRKNPGSAIQNLTDKVDGVRACVEGFPEAKSLEAFAACVEGLFSDELGTVNLSTVHKAKGLEADTVYIIRPEKLPLVWKNQREWEAEQEMNIDYVARTRAKEALIYVTSEE